MNWKVERQESGVSWRDTRSLIFNLEDIFLGGFQFSCALLLEIEDWILNCWVGFRDSEFDMSSLRYCDVSTLRCCASLCTVQGGYKYDCHVSWAGGMFVVLRNMTEMIHFILGSSIYRWGIMCISKLAVDWWKLVGVRRINSGYFLVWTYWMRTFMLRHELSLDSSVIIQYLFYMLSLSWVNTTPSRASCV